jgi:hypothetical protein
MIRYLMGLREEDLDPLEEVYLLAEDPPEPLPGRAASSHSAQILRPTR